MTNKQESGPKYWGPIVVIVGAVGVARGAVGASAPPRREIKFLGFKYGVSCKCTPEGESAPHQRARSHIFIGRGRVRCLIYRL